ncbi:kelch-like protein diablo [Paramacrobiotus metropolitanus]|uniref:kelch-like protein diablo n=1 Tax=Paramacrobiotus metropolitanus TaxID=2943436 RepID=UPI00244610A5|nr:kelch-like protein diablo [Paramacrobiotus metropolitanus]
MSSVEEVGRQTTTSESGTDSSKNARLRQTISEGFLRVLEDLKSTRTLCDVVLKGSENGADGIPCHRVVLCAHSSYFRTMFTSEWKEKFQSEIQLKNIPGGTLSELIHFAYTMEIRIDEENVQHVLTAALFLDIVPVAKMCWDFLEHHLDTSNCLMVHCLAEKHKNPGLAEKAKALVLRRFFHVSQSADFLLVNAQKIVELVASDALHVEKEDEVLQAVKRWFDHDPAGRKAHFSDILQFIRVTFLDPKCLEEYFLALLNGFITTPVAESSVRSGTIMEFPGRSGEAVASRCRPRVSYGLPKLIVCIGGIDMNDECLDEVAVFCPSMSAISCLKRLPEAIARSGVAVLSENSIYSCGGLYRSDDREVRDVIKLVWRYDSTNNEWEEVAPLQVPRSCHGTAVLNDRIYVAGGSYFDDNGDLTKLSSVECFDPQTNSWQFVAALPVALDDVTMVGFKDRLYVFGGDSGESEAVVRLSNKVFCYDPVVNAWSELADMPTARRWCSACVSPSGLIYVMGGDVGKPDISVRCTEAYDPTANKWLKRGDMIEKRSTHGCALVDGKIYVLGGISMCTDTSSIEFYDEATDKWTFHEARLPKAKSDFGCAVITLKRGMHLIDSRE